MYYKKKFAQKGAKNINPSKNMYTYMSIRHTIEYTTISITNKQTEVFDNLYSLLTCTSACMYKYKYIYIYLCMHDKICYMNTYNEV